MVDELLARAERSLEVAGLRPRCRALAVDLVYRLVPSARVFGLDVRWLIVGRDPERASRESRADRAAACGFKPELVRGGQDEEVVRHVVASAAAVLMRRRWLVFVANLVDHIQGWFHASAVESKAEISGNRAGLEAGAILEALLNGKLSRAAARKALLQLLCE
ncbi:MAG: hypothetical protein ACREIA_01665 [Opitutaceae bacterium]